MIVKFENIYISVHHEKYVLINLLRMYWLQFLSIENLVWSVLYMPLSKCSSRRRMQILRNFFFFFLINIAFFTLYFFIFARVWKLDFFKINETAKCILRWLKISIVVAWNKEGNFRNSILYKQLFSRGKNSRDVIRVGWSFFEKSFSIL